MDLFKKAGTLVIAGAFLIVALSIGGCTKYASPDDLQRLEEARQAAMSAERELEGVRAERSKTESELAAKKAELETAKQELDRAKGQ